MKQHRLRLLSLALLTFFSSAAVPKQDRWLNLAENEAYTARHECSFVQAGNKFVLFGGRESSKVLDMYDFRIDSWSKGTPAPKEFNHFQAIAHKGFIWVIGAFQNNRFPRELPEEHVWLYHIPTDNWIRGPAIPQNRRRGGAGLVVYKEKFYLLGGNTIGHDGGAVNWFDEYDPQKNTWRVLKNASEARDHFHAAVIGSTLYAAGGRRSGGPGGVFSPLIHTIDTYDFNTSTWSTLKNPLPTPRAASGIAVLDDELWVIGGEGAEPGPAYKTVEVYSPAKQGWSRKADLNFARHGTQAIRSGEGIFIAGGSPKRGGGNQRNMEVYNDNKPRENPLIAAKLIGPKKVLVPVNSSKPILLKNQGGNTASFISHIQIKDQSGQFSLLSNIRDVLVNNNESITLRVKNAGPKPTSTAEIILLYNGNIEKSIRLEGGH